MTRFEPWISDMEMTALPTELQPLPTILHYLSELGLPRVESKINYFNYFIAMLLTELYQINCKIISSSAAQANTIANLFLVGYLKKTPVLLTDVEQLQTPVNPDEIVVLRRKVDTGMGENDPVRKVNVYNSVDKNTNMRR